MKLIYFKGIGRDIQTTEKWWEKISFLIFFPSTKPVVLSLTTLQITWGTSENFSKMSEPGRLYEL